MGKPGNYKVYEFEQFRLVASHLMLYRDGEEVALAPKAVETLLVLLERRGEIVGKDELMKAIWTDSIVEESNLAQYLYVLRKTLGKQKDGRPFIETLRRRGYRFNGHAVVSEPSAVQNLRQVEEPVSDAAHADHNPKSAIPRVLRVQKRGNVLALADWKEAEADPAAEPQPVVLAAATPSKLLPSRRLYFGLAILAAVLTGAFSVFWFLSASQASRLEKGDLTFINLTSGELVDDAMISPDGNYFVYATLDGEKTHLWIQQTGQSNPREITDPFSGTTTGMTFSNDSKFVYFVVNEGNGALYRVPAFGGVRMKILDDLTTPVSFSPDGQEMVFMGVNPKTGDSTMSVTSTDGSRRRALIERSGADAESMNGGGAWSPDGRLIAYGSLNLKTPWTGSCSIVALDTQSGEIKPLSAEKWDTCFRMAWTRDGQGLVFIGTKANEAFSTRRDQIYYLSIATGEARRITTDGSRYGYMSLGVTSNDEIIALPHNNLSQIWTMDASGDSRTAKQITRGLADGRGGIIPLADGRVVYLTRNGDGFGIWQTNAEGTERKQLTTDPPEMQVLRSDPAGTFFVFSAKRDGWDHIYRLDSSLSNLVQLTFGETNEADSTVSPDGNWIVYSSTAYKGNRPESSLWKIPSTGGEAVQLYDGDCLTPHFSPDGSFISCVSRDWKTISIISSNDGKLTNTFATVESPILNTGARWTLDGKALTYKVRRMNAANLWEQPLTGEKARPLTDFTSGEVYNHAFSPDGSRLYIARGYPTRNAVLIRNFR